jgi:hypothetical protein
MARALKASCVDRCPKAPQLPLPGEGTVLASALNFSEVSKPLTLTITYQK